VGEWSFNPPNPIVGYTVGAEFSRPLSPGVLRQISGLYPQFSRELPRRVEQQALTLRVGGGPAPVPQMEIGGVVFDEVQRDGSTAAAVSVFQATATFMVAAYTRWVEFWPRAERLLRTVVTPGLSECPVHALVLTSNNRFSWSGDNPPRFALALRDTSRLIALNAIDCRGPFHSFHGYLEAHANPPGDRLVNVLVSSAPLSDGRFVLDVNFNFRLTLRDPASDSTGLFEPRADGRALLACGLDSLHQLNNRLFCDVIAPLVIRGIPGLPHDAG
jgi:uncharacterized protein (TIGR04255 family)